MSARAIVVASTADGRLALVDAESGAVIDAASERARGVVRDLAFDRWSRRVLLFEADESEDGGEIAMHAVGRAREGPRFGERAHLAWVDGPARLEAAPSGAVVFEDGYGARWKVLWNDGRPSQGSPAPRPASMWAVELPSGLALHALAYGEGGLERWRAVVDAAKLEPPAGARLSAGSGTDPPTARLAAAPALGGEVLADLEEGRPTLRLLREGETAPPIALDAAPGTERIEHAIAIDGGRIVALLISGVARVVVVRLDDGGGHVASAAVALPGRVRVEDRFFSRDLVAVSPRRLLAATSEGVFAVHVRAEGSSIHMIDVEVDAAFDGAELRGPLDLASEP